MVQGTARGVLAARATKKAIATVARGMTELVAIDSGEDEPLDNVRLATAALAQEEQVAGWSPVLGFLVHVLVGPLGPFPILDDLLLPFVGDGSVVGPSPDIFLGDVVVDPHILEASHRYQAMKICGIVCTCHSCKACIKCLLTTAVMCVGFVIVAKDAAE